VIVSAAELLLLAEPGETDVPVRERRLLPPRPMNSYPSDDEPGSPGKGIGLDRALSYASKKDEEGV